MANAINFEIKGLADLESKLEALPKEIERKLLREDLAAGAEMFQAAMIEEAPRDTGFLDSHFSIKTKVSGRDASGVSFIGPAANVDYPDRDGAYRHKLNAKGKIVDVGRVTVLAVARFLEFGTVKMPANAFMSRAFERVKDEVLDKLIAGIKESLEKVTR